jgi:hypothetical protein
MGYEIIFKYHPQLDDGSYDREETKELKKKVGDAYDDVPLEKVVSTILSQRARRDILIVDAEIFEYKKAKINFKETKGGIVIKHKKFLLDEDSNITVQEMPEESAPQVPALLPVPAMPATTPAAINNRVNIATSSRPIKWVVLDPDPQNLSKVKQKGLAFVPNKRYPVFAEVPGKQFGTNVYTIHDENRREVNVMDDIFLNADQKMLQGFYSSVDGGGGEPQLSGGYEKDNLPDIRGGGR